MRPVNRRDLVVVAVGLAVATWLVVRAAYGALPTLHWWLPVPLGLLAVAEAMAARALSTRLRAVRDARRRARGQQEPTVTGAARRGPAGPIRPVEPLLVARIAVLAQASAYVGAVFIGVWAGVLGHALPELGRLEAASGDAVAGVVGVLCAAALTVAALWLEHVCRVPPTADDDASGART